ncbi:MAG TPA: nucleotide exchange factor GrpE [Candidatus Saccharimonadales bacterium]|nr:nucleotide exchange factor GrpE [Candidatus Saccharimonadales bacterium]
MSKKIDPAELEQKLAELTEALQRERADSINLRRRVEEDKIRLASFYKAKVIRELLPALDNLERALKHVPKDLTEHDYVKGVQSVAKQFEQNLAALGVEKIRTVGEKFDPDLHEAIHMEDGEGDQEIVSEELQPGYKIGDEVIRHAVVKVKMEKK